MRLLDLLRACTPKGVNQAGPAQAPGPSRSAAYLEWGWAWPTDRRVLYNRASADPDGRPWSERKKYVWWDEEQGRVGRPGRARTSRRPSRRRTGRRRAPSGPAALRGDDPFIMQADGKGWLFVPNGLQDGPMPTHYEPHESPFRNALYGQQGNPTRKVYGRDDNPSNPSPPEPHSDVFPYVLFTSRLTEHHTAGGMSRNLPFLSELQPEMFVEVSPAAGRASAG